MLPSPLSNASSPLPVVRAACLLLVWGRCAHKRLAAQTKANSQSVDVMAKVQRRLTTQREGSMEGEEHRQEEQAHTRKLAAAAGAASALQRDNKSPLGPSIHVFADSAPAAASSLHIAAPDAVLPPGGGTYQLMQPGLQPGLQPDLQLATFEQALQQELALLLAKQQVDQQQQQAAQAAAMQWNKRQSEQALQEQHAQLCQQQGGPVVSGNAMQATGWQTNPTARSLNTTNGTTAALEESGGTVVDGSLHAPQQQIY